MNLATGIIAQLTERRLTIAIAESLTGGLLAAELISVPGASGVVRGAVVAYASEIKHSLLGVSTELLALRGAVHPEVAMQMAVGARTLFAVGGLAADVGIATTGVAGPGAHDGQPAGTAYIGIAIGADVRFVALELGGTREHIRNGVVNESLSALEQRLDPGGDRHGNVSRFDLVTDQ